MRLLLDLIALVLINELGAVTDLNIAHGEGKLIVRSNVHDLARTDSHGAVPTENDLTDVFEVPNRFGFGHGKVKVSAIQFNDAFFPVRKVTVGNSQRGTVRELQMRRIAEATAILDGEIHAIERHILAIVPGSGFLLRRQIN